MRIERWVCWMIALAGCAEEPLPCVGGPSPAAKGMVSLEPGVALILNQAPFNLPQEMTMRPDDDRFWYVALHGGFVVRFLNTPATDAFDLVLDITDRVSDDHDQLGLMSLAFHPDFEHNGQLVVFYNPRARLTGTTPDNLAARVSRFTSYDGGRTVDPDSEEILLEVSRGDGAQLHNGGHLEFGPDGYLWMSLGDGGGAYDPHGFAQDPHVFWGSLLRIDIDGGVPYAIPPDNPFADGQDGAPEVWAYGFRNPWQWTFDPETGEIWMADVGANHFEEVNYIERGNNYGWSTVEAERCVQRGCSTSGLTAPAYAYAHQGTSAVIGGRVYRGDALPELRGYYLFTDYFSTWLRGIRRNPDAPDGFDVIDIHDNLFVRFGSFAEGPDGEIWAINRRLGGFSVLRPPTERKETPVLPTRKLSQTGCVEPRRPWQAAARMTPYDLNAELWSDGASKERYFRLPPGKSVRFNEEGELIFPNGSVLMKNFRIQDRLVETRLLVRHEEGRWGGYSYRWRADGSDAVLLEEGLALDWGDQVWQYPSRNQCLHCHTAEAGYTLGPELLQLNRPIAHDGQIASQLAVLDAEGVFDEELPAFFLANALAGVEDAERSLEDRALSYLHANCASCHRGDNQTPELRFLEGASSYCEKPAASGEVDGATLLVKPGSPPESVLYRRLISHDPSVRMPPLAVSQVDVEGALLVYAWIQTMTGCE